MRIGVDTFKLFSSWGRVILKVFLLDPQMLNGDYLFKFHKPNSISTDYFNFCNSISEKPIIDSLQRCLYNYILIGK